VCLLPACRPAGERSEAREALEHIRAVHAAQTVYRSRFGRYGSLQELERAGVIRSGLAAAARVTVDLRPRGYRITVRPDNCGGCAFHSDESLALRRRPAR
jgi:hypothetical protein